MTRAEGPTSEAAGPARPAIDLRLRSLQAAYELGAQRPADVLGEVLAACVDARADGTLLALADRAVVLERAADLEVRRQALGVRAAEGLPLFGVPVIVKDNVDVAGLPTTAGCRAYAYQPARSAPSVRRLEDAGAVVVGKANMDQFATGLVGVRCEEGPPPNALDPLLIPGGSSSGSAVAVARGLATLAVGTDTAGSGRVPAAMNGVVGWKAPPGRVSSEGVVPASWSLDCVSLFAADVAGALVAGQLIDPGGSWRSVRPGRVGVLGREGLVDCSEPVVAGMRWLARHLSDRVAVETVDVGPLFDVGDLLYDGPWLAERTAALGEFIEANLERVHPVVAEIVLGGRRWSAVDVYRAERTRRGLEQGPLAEMWRAVDVLVVPTLPWLPTQVEVEADPLGVNRSLGRFTNFANLLGLAALALPVSEAPRAHPAVPLGVTLLAPAGREGMLVGLAELLDREVAGVSPWIDVMSGDAGPRSQVVVAGAHMSGFPLEHQLRERDAVLVQRTTTAPCYRLHHLASRPPDRPALERVPAGGAAIEVEVWSIPTARLGGFLNQVMPPLAIGTVRLADGSDLLGFVCESGGLVDAVDITAHGGWRSYMGAHPR